jgi:dolichol-phosphate mannosyltransferase
MLKERVIPSYGQVTVTNTSTDFFALSVIVPTRNEAGNIEMLLDRINHALEGVPTEVLFVDDSTDDTPQVVAQKAELYPALSVRLIHRSPEQRTGGLGGAVVLGLQNVQSDYACVMDGDLQHPPELLPALLKTAHEKEVDLVVATRRSEESQVSGLNLARNQISRLLDLAGRIFFPVRLKGVSDPLSGFFLVRVAALDLSAFHPDGFKILMEILVRTPGLKKAEVPFHFGERFAGTSKASVTEAWKYFKLLLNLRFGESTVRFTSFALVGVSGLLVNSLVLYLATSSLHIFYLISAAIATVASTLWNFVLVEAWVYRAGNRTEGRFRRLGMFYVMNVIALGARSPLIFIMTSVLGIHYVLSNLVSLVFLTVLRFFTADYLIWGRSSVVLPGANQGAKAAARSSVRVYSYNIHNLVTVVSEGELPELQPFQVLTKIEAPTIYVKIGFPRRQPKGREQDSNYLHYHELLGRLGFDVGIQMGEQVNVVASPLMRLSPHVLYTNVVEPILRWTFVRKGYALVHGATLAFGKNAYLITARTDTGKTTTLLKILAHQRRDNDQAAFLSDDMTIVSSDGVALTYPKPLTISHHTLRAIKSDYLTFRERLTLPLQSRIHSRSGRKVASFISRYHWIPAATINMFMQMVVPPPKYFVSRLVPNVKLSRVARFAGMFIIERGGEGYTEMENGESLEVLLSNCEDAYGFPPYNDLKEFLYMRDGVDLRLKEQEIIRKALGEFSATLIRSTNLDWWCQIPPFVSVEVASSCSCEEKHTSRSLQRETVPSLPGE